MVEKGIKMGYRGGIKTKRSLRVRQDEPNDFSDFCKLSIETINMKIT